MKRSIAIVILIVILINTILPRYAFAALETFEDLNGAYTVQAYNALNDDGSAEIRSDGQVTQYTSVKDSPSFFRMIIVFLASVIDVLPIAVQGVITLMTNDGYEYTTSDNNTGNDQAYFTIESLVKGDRPLLNANFFKFDTKSERNNKIKESIAVLYNALKNLAIIVSLVVLIYIGIRMALSTVATDRAMYKKMLMGWFEGFILIFIMPYILVVAMTLSDSLTTLIKDSVVQTRQGFEITIIDNFYTYLKDNVGYQMVVWSVAYCVLIAYQLRFLIAYVKRFFSIGILMVISPIVGVTYAIDKAGDGKAQGFGMLIKELLVNIFIQPLHVIIFQFFIITAGAIATKAPIIAIAFLFALSRVEKMVKTVFDMRGLVSIHSIGHFLPFRKKGKH